MANRKVPFVNNEFYHVYNRGVDKRDIFSNQYDLERFFQSMKEFNSVDPIGSIYRQSFEGIKKAKLSGSTAQLVNFIAYCLNPNHYHFILEQLVDGGISEYMKRLSGGYTWHFNNKNERSGALFQGRFKSVHVSSNEYLLHLSSYVNLNYRVHQLSGSTAQLVKSSLDEYLSKEGDNFCKKDIILSQFKDGESYKRFTEESLEAILSRRKIPSNFLIE